MREKNAHLDQHGHAVGDQVLRQFTAHATSLLRPGAYLGRSGGEEFVAVLPATDLTEAFMMAERFGRNHICLAAPEKDTHAASNARER